MRVFFLIISTYYPHPLPLWTNWWLHLLVIAATGETAAARKFVQTTRGGVCVVGVKFAEFFSTETEKTVLIAVLTRPLPLVPPLLSMWGKVFLDDVVRVNHLSPTSWVLKYLRLFCEQAALDHTPSLSRIKFFAYHPQCWHTIYAIFLWPSMNMCVCVFF